MIRIGDYGIDVSDRCYAVGKGDLYGATLGEIFDYISEDDE